MKETVLPILLILIPSSVLGEVENVLWTTYPPKKWSTGGLANESEASREQGVYLALVESDDDDAYVTNLTEYDPNNHGKAHSYRLNNQTSWVNNDHLQKQINKKGKVKLTVVALGERNVEPFPDTGNQYGVKYSIREKSPQQLAAIIHAFVQKMKITPHERMRFITCNAGSQAAVNYMTRFIKEINKLETTIREVLAYRIYVAEPEPFEVGTSGIRQHAEEVMNYFKSKGVYEDYFIDEKFDELLANNFRDDPNNVQMLFLLDDYDDVYRYNFVKPTSHNNYRKTEMSINLDSGLESLQDNLEEHLRKFVEDFVIKENTLTIEKGHVKVEIVNRNIPEDTHIVSYPLDESFYLKQIKESAKKATSLVKAGPDVLKQINSKMIKYATVAGFIRAWKFFAQNDTTRGAMTLSKSLHGLGEWTNRNQKLSRISQKAFQKSLEKAAGKLGMEKTLSKVGVKSVERIGESAAGQVLKSIPVVSLVFQGWDIAEDVKAIKPTNRSDPDQNKYYGLEFTNLAVDVTTTALMIGEGVLVFTPAAPAVAGVRTTITALTIVKMSIGDFYCDIVRELDKLPQGADNAKKLSAVLLGLQKGAANYVTDGLWREMEDLEKEAKQNQERLHNLSQPESYYKITADIGNVSSLDLMGGKFSQYGGFVTVQLIKNGSVAIQIGGVDDGKGGVKTIRKIFYNPSIQNIVLGIGDSSKSLSTQKAAHLFWVISVNYTKVMNAEIKLYSTLFGPYYDNDKYRDKDNTLQKHGKMPEVEFVIRNYHYDVYGHGGDDTFILGPQTSVLSRGEGRDLYVFPTNGTHAEIDNFSQDMLEDFMLIKSPFKNIDCSRSHTDLLLIYGPERYRITIKDWFVHSTVDHYQHMTFQSSDGVTFRIVDYGLINRRFHTKCVPETLDKSKSACSVSLHLDGEFKSVIKVMGSNYSDTIVGNKNDNVLNGGYGADMLEGGAGADTYVILQGQGCDRINNYAKDEKIDILVFNVPFSRIQAYLQDEDLMVVDEENVNSTCVRIAKWTLSRYYQHLVVLSSDHVMFQISNNESEVTITALMVDLSNDIRGSTVNLSDPSLHKLYVLTVFDSAYDDVLIGNALGNFLSCSGGRDHLQGEGGSDKYVIKSGCTSANISNFAEDLVSDILFIEQPFLKLRVEYQWPHVILKVEDSETEIHLQNWLKGKEFQHLVLQTIDGFISMLPYNFSEPEVITPFEIDLSRESCIDHKKIFDFRKPPFMNVEHFKAKSSNCSYSVFGNSKDNYIDPGIGNPMKYQYLMGGNGSDTYVFGHGYGYGNEIDNEAKDMKTDHLFLEVLYQDIVVFLEPPHIALSSKSRNDSVHVRLIKYLQGPEYQHLLIKSSDGFFFQVNPLSYPYKSVLYIDTSTSTKSCNISCAEGKEFLNASHIYGATKFSNYITGSRSSSVIKGGNNHDYLQGNEGNERIEGGAGDDVIVGNGGDDSLFGGEGDDNINGGAGNDLIYGGRGADKVNGGPGFDTVFFIGDVRTSTGVSVDLKSGKGTWADAENDIYTGVEAVSGTNFNDVIIGDNEDNNLEGKFGNDILIPGHGSDDLNGGPGKDLYILDECSGVKRINNFASDKAQDCILIRDFAYSDACFFLLKGTLVISLSHQVPLLSLFQRNDLTILLEHWSNRDSFYQHVDFVFANDTIVRSSSFKSATEISSTLSELSSTSPGLTVRTSTETEIQVEVKGLNKTKYTEDVRFQYHVKVSDELFFSDSLNWENQTVIRYSGLLPGVFYTFQLYASMCEFPLLELAKTTQRTKPNPPTSIIVSHITHSSASIEWAAPSPDSDPNSSQYTYVVDVISLRDITVTQIMTNLTNVEITGLKPGTAYRVSLSSVIEEVKSQNKTIQMKTSNLCPTYTAPEGTRVIDEKMTRNGSVVVIECEEAFKLTSGPEILCLEPPVSSPCVPKTCTHKYKETPHGSVVEKVCFTSKIQSMCQFGKFSPPIPLCCSEPNAPVRLEPPTYIQELFSISVNAACPRGYRLSGPSQLVCNLTAGQWDQPILPSCSLIPCLDPLEDPHGRFLSLTGKSGNFKEGDDLVLECDAQYHPSKGRITCRNGVWDKSFCEANARLINVTRLNGRLYGQLQQWRSGQWTEHVASKNAENLARFCCENLGMLFVRLTGRLYLRVECSIVKLDTSGQDYMGKPEVKQADGWKKICIRDVYAAKSFCGMVFPGQEWTVALLQSTPFQAEHTYQCGLEHCSLDIKQQQCNTQIQCRAMCDLFSIPNGNICDTALEGDTCSVSCNRLYKRHGASEIQCLSNGWSDLPKCFETGECGYDNEKGPHSLGCLKKLWAEAGCNHKALTEGDQLVGHYKNWTVAELRERFARSNCKVDNKCFPGHATVFTSDWKKKPMSELKVGDKVLALDTHGELVFSEVILWLDRQPATMERYILLTTEGYSDPVSLSADHLTFIATSNGTVDSVATMIPVFAKDLLPGHLIHRYDPVTGVLVARRVTDINESIDLGAYAPLTVEGNLIVDGHLVSCYALQCRQSLAHLPFAPYRILHTLRSFVPLFKELFPVKQEKQAKGKHWYANIWHKVGKWLNFPFGKTCYPRELSRYHFP